MATGENPDGFAIVMINYDTCSCDNDYSSYDGFTIVMIMITVLINGGFAILMITGFSPMGANSGSLSGLPKC